MRVVYCLLWLVTTLVAGQPSAGILCQPNTRNEFIFSVNFHTGGKMGEFEVIGCDGTSPVLAFQRGITYTFLQHDLTNWMHPLGLAYYPDGHHGDLIWGDVPVPEMKYPAPEDCDKEEFLCNPGENVKQAPLYGIDGVYETFADWDNRLTSGQKVYEENFKATQKQWKKQKHSVKITVPLESKSKEFFYFCQIHAGMSGLIKVTDAVENANSLVKPFDPKKYYQQADRFDSSCGTSEVSLFHTDKEKFCPGQNFLCETRKNKAFSMCMEAIGCKMNYEMRVEEDSNPLVVFMHQMIPHHVNAVNMARIALKHGTDADGYDDWMVGFLIDIINKQNHQIQRMDIWLKKRRKTVPKYCTSLDNSQETSRNPFLRFLDAEYAHY